LFADALPKANGLFNHDLLDLVALVDGIDCFQAFDRFVRKFRIQLDWQ